MSQPTIENVYAAIDALYHSQKIEGKEEASKWLDQFQQSVNVFKTIIYTIPFVKEE